MKPEYDLSKMKKRPNPFAKQLKEQVTIPLGIEGLGLWLYFLIR